MTVEHQIKIDLQAPGIAPVVHAVQLDSNTRVVKAALFSGGIPYEIDGNAEVSLACIKPDRTQCWYDELPDGEKAVSVAGNVVAVTLVPEVLTVSGIVKATLLIRNGLEKQISTFPFVITVAQNPAAGIALSNNYYKITSAETFNNWAETVVCCTEQSFTPEQKAQILKNIGAMAAGVQNDVRIFTNGENSEEVILETEVRQSGAVALQHHASGSDMPTILGSVAPGEKDSDAATVGQLNDAVAAFPIKYIDGSNAAPPLVLMDLEPGSYVLNGTFAYSSNSENGQYPFANTLVQIDEVDDGQKSVSFQVADEIVCIFFTYDSYEFKRYCLADMGIVPADLTYNPKSENAQSGIAIEQALQPMRTDIDVLCKNIEIKSWKDVQEVVRAGVAAKIFDIGDQFISTKDDIQLVWDIIGFDHDVPADSQFKHSMTIQLHDCYTSAPFDEPEALCYCAEELPVGTYNFTLLPGYETTLGGGKTYQFTLTKAVPAGGQIMFPWSYDKQASTVLISTYESATSTTAIESVSVAEGSGGTNLGTADGKTENMNHSHKIRYGSSRWLHSSIRQWLKSNKAASAWWTPQNVFDRPPSNASTAGFLTGMDSEFLAVIGEVTKRTSLNTITDGGGYEDTKELMFLLSRSELYGGLANSVNEGGPYPYYANYSELPAAGTGVDSNRIKYRAGSAQNWWQRSPGPGAAYGVYNVNSTGAISDSPASYSRAIVPVCNII